MPRDPLNRGALDRVVAALREVAEPRRHRHDRRRHHLAEARVRSELHSTADRRDEGSRASDER